MTSAGTYQLLPEAKVDQEVVPVSPDVRTVGVVVGWEPGVPDKLTLAVMRGDAVLYRAASRRARTRRRRREVPPESVTHAFRQTAWSRLRTVRRCGQFLVH
ncbi:hypothetical protein Hesp01_01200 [Herbidospora sp. NBRC 101105]|nr:hypothetical protein Hesp01_01200 [Herbidospora sp. NBRC 101105]